MNVVSISEYRGAASSGDRPLACVCGSEWFELQLPGGSGAVTASVDGRITGYAGALVCRDCGSTQK